MPFPDLQRRRLQPELMDDPELDVDRHLRALRALERVNLLSGTAGRIWKLIRGLERPSNRPLRVMDLACGGGDVVVALQRRADRHGMAVEVHGSDRSPVALDHARRAAQRAGVEVHFHEADLLSGPLPEGYDLLTSSLFLHHLDPHQARHLLRAMSQAASTILVQDLRRTRTGYLLAALTLNTVARSDVARVDGLRSVAGAFTLDEVDGLAREAGLKGFTLRRCWPQRFALYWRRP